MDADVKRIDEGTQKASSLGHEPSPDWRFDESVVAVFEDMLARSIPDYEGMRKLTTDLAAQFFIDYSNVLDLGCSKGAMYETMGQHKFWPEHQTYVGLDSSLPMIEHCRATYGAGTGFWLLDLTVDELPVHPESCSVVLSVLTMQFVPINYRQELLRRIYDAIRPGGAFIMVEKVLGESAGMTKLWTSLYWDMKEEHGYTMEEIDRKRISLDGVLVPVTASWNQDLLEKAGFSTVDCYWRCMNFAGWIAVKE